MVGKLHTILLILCMGIFIMPKQLLSTPSNTMECCEKRDSSVQSCHKEKDKTPAHSHEAGCTGSCCAACGVCSVTVSPALAADLFQPPVNKKFTAEAAKTPYTSPFFSFYLKEIWQPPKIS